MSRFRTIALLLTVAVRGLAGCLRQVTDAGVSASTTTASEPAGPTHVSKASALKARRRFHPVPKRNTRRLVRCPMATLRTSRRRRRGAHRITPVLDVAASGEATGGKAGEAVVAAENNGKRSSIQVLVLAPGTYRLIGTRQRQRHASRRGDSRCPGRLAGGDVGTHRWRRDLPFLRGRRRLSSCAFAQQGYPDQVRGHSRGQRCTAGFPDACNGQL